MHEDEACLFYMLEEQGCFSKLEFASPGFRAGVLRTGMGASTCIFYETTCPPAICKPEVSDLPLRPADRPDARANACPCSSENRVAAHGAGAG